MTYPLNPKISDLKPYDPISGEYRIRLDANESYLGMPEPIREEMEQAIEKMAFNRYPDPAAARLCAAFADYYGVDPGCVTAGNGSDELISVILSAFLMKGDKVLTLSPDFSMYRFYASIVEGESIVLQKEADLETDIDKLIETANSQKVSVIMLSNPCNPTSLGVKREEMRRLIRSVSALVVLDEAYMDFWDESLLPEFLQYDNLIILRTSSKAVGSAAIRLGFAVANETLTNVLRAVKSPYNVNSMTQAMGVCVFSHKKVLENAKKQLLKSVQWLYNEINRLGASYPERVRVFETCTNFVLIETKEAKEIFAYLLHNSVAVRLMGSYLRITAGSEAENKELIMLLTRYFTDKAR